MSKTKTARDGSIVVATFQLGLSRIRSAINHPERSIQLAETSSIGRFGSQIGHHLTNAAEQSFVGVIAAFILHAIRQSFLYRWLTAEPDPDVVVIDLRETWTVGPIIVIFDRILGVLVGGEPNSHVAKLIKTTAGAFRDQPIRLSSTLLVAGIATGLLFGWISGMLTIPAVVVLVGLSVLALVGLRSEHSLAELQETKIVSLLITAFEPPEPPTEPNQADRAHDNTDPSKQNK